MQAENRRNISNTIENRRVHSKSRGDKDKDAQDCFLPGNNRKNSFYRANLDFDGFSSGNNDDVQFDLNAEQNSTLPKNNLYNFQGNGYQQPMIPGQNNTNIKKSLFSMIDNVLGGAQSSTAQISNITNNLSNVSGISQEFIQPQMEGSSLNVHYLTQPQQSEQFGFNVLDEDDKRKNPESQPGEMSGKFQKLNDESNSNMMNNTTMMNSTSNNENLVAQNSFNSRLATNSRLLDSSLFTQGEQNYQNSHQPIPCATPDMKKVVSFGHDNSNYLFQNPANYIEDEFQIKKMKSYNQATNSNQAIIGQHENSQRVLSTIHSNDCENQSSRQDNSNKKRARKAYTKKNKKNDEMLAPQLERHESGNTQDDQFGSDDETMNVELGRLTNKKKQYLQDAIFDKNGAYSYLEDPVEYKKARKRLQNRESAVRSRQRKKTYQEELEQTISNQNTLIESLTKDRNEFAQKNAALSSENTLLKQQLTYFQDTFANSSLVGGGFSQPQTNIQAPAPILKNDPIQKIDLDQFKLEILQKINRRFDVNEKEMQEKQKREEDSHIIKRQKYDEQNSQEEDFSDTENKKDPFETLMAEEYADYTSKKNKSNKRQRLNSGKLIKNDQSYSYSTTSDVHTDESNVFVLKRDPTSSAHNKGYFFLAVFFGMMCGSSYMSNNQGQAVMGEGSAPVRGTPEENQIISSVPEPAQSSFHDFKMIDRKLKATEIQHRFENMNLLQSDVSDPQPISDNQNEQIQAQQLDKKEINLKNTAHLMKNLGQLNTKQINESMAGPLSGLIKNIIQGKYTYLTYLMCSTACFFFWMTPNYHKVRLIRPKRQAAQHHHAARRHSNNKDIEMELQE